MSKTLETITGTKEENLFCALLQEELMNRCGPFDPYYRIAKINVEYFLECAANLEKGINVIQTRVSRYV